MRIRMAFPRMCGFLLVLLLLQQLLCCPPVAVGRITSPLPQQRRFSTTTFYKDDYNTSGITDVYVHPTTRDVFACSCDYHVIVRISAGDLGTTHLSSTVVAGQRGNSRFANGNFADGVGTSARFNCPFGITGDGADMLYVSDQKNYRIRSTNMSRDVFNVSTLAGSGTSGNADGDGAIAMFTNLHGVALNANHTVLYVADYNTIRRVNLSLSFVSTVSTVGRVSYPVFIALTFDDQFLYVSASGGSNIVVLNLTSGIVSQVTNATTSQWLTDSPYGNAETFSEQTAGINQPTGVLLTPDYTTLIVSDERMNAIRCVKLATSTDQNAMPIITIAGNGTAGYIDASPNETSPGFSTSFMAEPSTPMFSSPKGMAWWQVTNSSWTFLVADYDNNAIRAVTLDNDMFDPFPPSTLYTGADVVYETESTGSLSSLYWSTESGTLYAVENFTQVVMVMEMDGTSSSFLSSTVIAGSNASRFANVTNAVFTRIVAMTGVGDDYLYVADGASVRCVNLTTETFNVTHIDMFSSALAAIAVSSSLPSMLFVATAYSISSASLSQPTNINFTAVHNALSGRIISAMYLSAPSSSITTASLFVAYSNTIDCLEVSLSTTSTVVTRIRTIAGNSSSTQQEGFGMNVDIPSAITDLVVIGDVYGWPCLYVKTFDASINEVEIHEIRLFDQYVRTLHVFVRTESELSGMTYYSNRTDFGILMSLGSESTHYKTSFISLGRKSVTPTLSDSPFSSTATTSRTSISPTASQSLVTYSNTNGSRSLSASLSSLLTLTESSSCAQMLEVNVRPTACTEQMVMTADCVTFVVISTTHSGTSATSNASSNNNAVRSITIILLAHQLPQRLTDPQSSTVSIPVEIPLGWALRSTMDSMTYITTNDTAPQDHGAEHLFIKHIMMPSPHYGNVTNISLIGECLSGGLTNNVTISILWPQRSPTASPSPSLSLSATLIATTSNTSNPLSPSNTVSSMTKSTSHSETGGLTATPELELVSDVDVVSSATVSLLSSSAILSLLSGGGAASSISVVMLSFLQCSNHPPVSVATYFVSVFFDLGSAATAIGNVGLCYAVYFLQMTIVAVVSRWKRIHPAASAKEGPVFSQQIDEKPTADSQIVTLPTELIELMAQLRCPSIGVKVANLLLPGAALGVTAGFTSHTSSAGDVGVCVVACLLMMSVIGAQVAALRLVVLPHATFAPYRHYVVGTMFEKRFLFPEARWEPMTLNQAFSPLMATMREGFPMLLVVELLLACFIGVVSGAFIGGACDSPLLAIAATLYLLYGIVLAVLRPYRLPMDRACAPVVNILLGILCALQYADTRNSTSSAGKALQLAVSLLQVIRSLCSLFIVNAREGDLRCGDPIDGPPPVGDETNHNKQIDVVMLAEDEPMPLLEDAEMTPITFEQAEAQEEDLMLLNLGDLHEGNFWDERGRAVEGSVEHAMMRGDNDLLRLFSEVTTEQE